MNRLHFSKGIFLFGLAFCFAVLNVGCGNNSSQKTLDTTTSGEISMSVDETFEPIVQAELDVFHGIYPAAKINAHFKSEGEAVADLLNDSARAIIVTRQLTADELKPLQAKKLVVRSTKFAIDAIALIVNPANNDSTFSMANLRDLFAGNITKWNQLDKANSNEEITIVFDNPNSSTVRYMKELAGKNQFSAKNFYSVKTNKEVIEYVSTHKNSLGIIGVNWISDADDSAVTGFLKKVKIAAIAPDDGQPGSGQFRKPYQAYIAQGFYPLVRRVYLLSRESYMGLGTGFAAFIAGDKGQRIVLKSGLVPATMPVRLVQISDNDLFK
ncbi:phosphate ABC transporter substrate-binding protein, PhoT family [Solitalea longa]|uniref:Phosphate ABC transporter substrate-binding protein, PhoT family n=1 Tax=Solitalea longa TaxID=2079460 RepID=A0A2S5A3G1_9SPHI|nr:substrate-binding domain-containing protein [Solitalea longa]POY37085.1 phosphate ABC transporter substrate-binding protein, PhoT family [Solitalea longa]